MTNLWRRLCALERAAWDRRKRQILRVAFSDAAQDRGWTTDRLEREVQVALDEFNRMEPALLAICRRGGTGRDLAAYIAEKTGMDVDEMLTAAARLPRESASHGRDAGEVARRH